jgi:hypothetical protein
MIAFPEEIPEDTSLSQYWNLVPQDDVTFTIFDGKLFFGNIVEPQQKNFVYSGISPEGDWGENA